MNVCGRELLAHVTHLYIQHDNLRALTIKTFCGQFVFGFDYPKKEVILRQKEHVDRQIHLDEIDIVSKKHRSFRDKSGLKIKIAL